MAKEEDKPKVARVLAGGRKLTFDDVMNFFRKLTGREPTKEQLEEALGSEEPVRLASACYT